uniref:Guanylate cyclase domain-containing protein n=1 Tax=Tetraselmis chuii TaxID=63592 RepID=A0A7S1SJ16_9CHLO|mmetsp:Transcript_10585/g.19190  ORF Transcript_10585/g.19190 Transcript_10585/m.19190 type:complete len:527 (+) Transcript_10585:112-1692(+)
MGNACCTRAGGESPVAYPATGDLPSGVLHKDGVTYGHHSGGAKGGATGDSAASLTDDYIKAIAASPPVPRPSVFSKTLSTRGDVGLDILLQAPKTAGPSREAVFETVTKKIKGSGYALLMKLEVETEEPLAKLGALQYVRAGLNIGFWEIPSLRVIKMDDERVFALCHDASHAVQAAIVAMRFCEAFEARHPEALPLSLSVGVSHGDLMVLRNDFYGDPVNVASKLGEDNGEPGDIAIAQSVTEKLQDTSHGRQLLSNLDLDPKNVLISGVEIPYALVKLREGVDPTAILPSFAIPSDTDVYNWVSKQTKAGALSPAALSCLESLSLDWPAKSNAHKTSEQLTEELMLECTMMQSDMSGFTRLTRKYGILHFLTLIINCRRIYDEVIPEFGGQVVKYDGDNVITFFSEPADASNAAAALLQRVNEYNMGLHKDFQIRLKFGMATGDVLIVDHDIAGPAWDECCVLGEDLAEIGEVLVSPAVRRHKSMISFRARFEDRAAPKKRSKSDGMAYQEEMMQYFNMMPGSS